MVLSLDVGGTGFVELSLWDVVVAGTEVSAEVVALDIFSDEVMELSLAEIAVTGDVDSVNLLGVSEEITGVAAEILVGILV